MKIRVLIIEDHSAMIEGFKSILSYSRYAIEYDTALESKEGLSKIEDSKKEYDVIFLDISIPPLENAQIYSGLDLGIRIRKSRPSAQLIVITSHIESLMLYSVLKEIQPEGILVKSDFTPQEFLDIFDRIICGEKIYTKTVTQSIRDVNGTIFHLDSLNRQILLLLNEGNRTKSLPRLLNLSLSAIDKRKVVIKDFLGIDKGNDEDILREAKRRGLI